MNPNWSSPYAKQPEILKYMQGVAEKYGIIKHCNFNEQVLDSSWDEKECKWHIKTDKAEYTTDIM